MATSYLVGGILQVLQEARAQSEATGKKRETMGAAVVSKHAAYPAGALHCARGHPAAEEDPQASGQMPAWSLPAAVELKVIVNFY